MLSGVEAVAHLVHAARLYTSTKTINYHTLSGECARCSLDPIMPEPMSDLEPELERARPAKVLGLSWYDLASSWLGLGLEVVGLGGGVASVRVGCSGAGVGCSCIVGTHHAVEQAERLTVPHRGAVRARHALRQQHRAHLVSSE